MLRTFYLPLMAALGVLICAESAQACSCISGGPPCQAYGNTAAVFIGTPTAVDKTTVKRGDGARQYDYPQRLFTFSVEETFRGVDAAKVQVVTGMGGGDCGYNFQIGEHYLIYAGRDPNSNVYGTSICTRTRLVSEAGEDLEYIRSLPKRDRTAALSGEVRRYRRNLETDQTEQLGPLSEIEIAVEGADNTYRARTDKEGHYILTGLVPGKYKVKALLPKGFGGYTTEQETVLNERGCGVVTFYVTDNGRITGRVVDAGGQPVPRILVDLIPASQTESERPHVMYTSADDDGRFDLKFVPPGSYLLGIRLYDLSGPDDAVAPYPRTYYPGVAKASDAALLTVTESEAVEGKELRLLPRLVERTISGKVVLPDGRPAARASVAHYDVAYNPRPMGYAITADDQGNFSFIGYEGLPYYVSAVINDADGRQRHAEPVDVPPTGSTKDIVLIITEANGTCPRCLNYRYGQKRTKQP
jgi:hypothetical protein